MHCLVDDLGACSTSLTELASETSPRFIGASDAAKAGMGGIWIPPADDSRMSQPMLWWQPFPKHIQDTIVSHDNPGGKVTKSDPELAASIAHYAILAHYVNIQHATAHTFCDNWERTTGRVDF